MSITINSLWPKIAKNNTYAKHHLTYWKRHFTGSAHSHSLRYQHLSNSSRFTWLTLELYLPPPYCPPTTSTNTGFTMEKQIERTKNKENPVNLLRIKHQRQWHWLTFSYCIYWIATNSAFIFLCPSLSRSCLLFHRLFDPSTRFLGNCGIFGHGSLGVIEKKKTTTHTEYDNFTQHSHDNYWRLYLERKIEPKICSIIYLKHTGPLTWTHHVGHIFFFVYYFSFRFLTLSVHAQPFICLCVIDLVNHI